MSRVMVFFSISLLLSSCAAKPEIITQTKVIVPDVPADLLRCMPEPALPPATTQGQIADFLVADDEAGQDCRMRLAAVASVFATDSPTGKGPR